MHDPHTRTNPGEIPPVTQGSPAGTELDRTNTGLVDESNLAVSGIMAVIYERLISRIEEKIENKLEIDTFIREVGDSARESRNFEYKSVVHLPESPEERIASSYRHYQMRRIKKIGSLIHGIRLLYDKQSDPVGESSVIIPTASEMSPARQIFRQERIELFEKSTKSRDKSDSSPVLDFTPGRHATRKTRKSIARSQRRYERLDTKRRKIHSSIDRGASGDTFFGKRRKRKIEKLQEKKQRFINKLGRP
jgi:hypothetical protein